MVNKNFIEGIKIIEKYIPYENEYGYNITVEHEQFWIGLVEWVDNEHDREILLELGWFVDQDRWSCNISC